MALFNKLFSSRKRNYNKNQDNVCEKLFQFTNDQVRVVLFRECDSRVRKLLFDSQAIQKIQLANQTGQSQQASDPTHVEKEKKTYAEVSNGYGYLYSKPNSDISQLSEMIFGSVAMSYRGTSYKIHSLTSPSRFMCTQVFPCPRQTARGRSSAPGRTWNNHHEQSNCNGGVSSLMNLQHSFKLEDSSASCTTCTTTSFSDQSVRSTASDTLLVCRRNRSVPLDVPQQSGANINSSSSSSSSSNIPSCSVTGDSGFGGGQSLGSFSSSLGLQSFPHCDPNTTGNGRSISFPCGSIYKRWLRSASTSLEYSASSLIGSASADECYLRPHPRTGKLGLAIIIQLTNGQEEIIQKFLLEHAALIDTMMWRVRRGSEVAFLRHVNFLSLMSEVATHTTRWLRAFLTGPHLCVHMWQSLSSLSSSNCDIFTTSITDVAATAPNPVRDENVNGDSRSSSSSVRSASQERLNFSESCASLTSSVESSVSVDGSSCSTERNDFVAFLNLSRFFKNDCSNYSSKRSECASGSTLSGGGVNNNNRSFLAEKFVRELCELLETVDVKHTNFFVSTLITAVLTHHLGWVATILDCKVDDEKVIEKVQKTGNPLWGQLNDLYGAVGCPTKMAHTVVTGSNKSELITKMLNTLTYFIRCNNVLRKSISRWDIVEENCIVDGICREKHCIPKENYKKYQDHLDEMAVTSTITNSKKSDFFNRVNLDLKLDTSKINRIMRYSELKKLDNCSSNGADETFENEKTISNNNIKPLKGLTKTTTCLSELNGMVSEEQKENDACEKNNISNASFTSINSLPSDTKNEEHFGLTNEDIAKKVHTLFRGLKDVSNYHSEQEITRQYGREYLEKQRSSSSVLLSADKNKSVVFVLGENEELVGIKSKHSVTNNNNDNSNNNSSRSGMDKTKSAVSNEEENQTNSNSNDIPGVRKLFFNDSLESSVEEESICSDFKDADFVKCTERCSLKPSTSFTYLKEDKIKVSDGINCIPEATCSSTSSFSDQGGGKKKSFSRSQSEPPEHVKTTPNTSTSSSSSKPRFRYTGVKFNFQQHPQIFTNYMKSKNIELSNLSFSEKAIKFNSGGLSTNFDFSNCEDNFEEVETLQTPSNASELEFTSELGKLENVEVQHAKESTEKVHKTCFKRNFVPNTMIKEPTFEESPDALDPNTWKKEMEDLSSLAESHHKKTKALKLIELPMPKSAVSAGPLTYGYTSSLFRGINDCYTSDMVLQGISVPKTFWESSLRKDLTVAARHPLLDQSVEEVVAIVADTDTWEVQLVSSHTYVIDNKSSSGVRIGMSQLVANMLESLLRMWKLQTPPEHCLMHIEQRLEEFCTKSQALAQLLLATDFCSMELLTTSLQLEINDIPLLMAVASTHSPQITQKYGLSFQ